MPQREASSRPPASARIATRFFPLSAALRPYASTIYLTEVAVPGDARVEDYLHPEWANMRFIEGEAPLAAIGGGPVAVAPRFVVTGPTSQASYFAAGNMRAWGIGILPVGWAKFVPLSAEELADRSCDGGAHPAFARFAPLADALRRANDVDVAAALIDGHFCALLADAPPDDPAILSAHGALVDEELASVADLSARLGLSERSIERLSRRAFGFSPKLLLRRQRFLRSLARFMLDPSMAWIDTMDHHYYDQAQFTRDFRRFMGMGPREYAARPKPILGAAAVARAAAAGAAVQGLHKPAG
ncbi:MAG TPA: helix-turn-helix domain-containing protein [Sphingopyxis sp.]|uniref:helix-turn-helix domain-containing protein n=1 Tax=Sphingopyxis sp. TaxID=1908224 RepID=UPI002C165DA2|nr:helix-turn-helix domain-containing protein [Sphingopyxis sp.]HWW56869.1 helix-turn-helix domain-containing protein [Sphingopyxis sp.]